MSSHGNHNAEYQYFQTVHHKPLIGGYMSRLPKNQIEAVRQFRLMRVLLDMSAGAHLSDERIARASHTARATLEEMNVGYVVINNTRTTRQLRDFALNALSLTHIASDGPVELYTTSLHGSRPEEHHR
jgi:hypothetical protein